MEAYIGSVWSFGFNFAPLGWMQCNGQLLPISEYTPLFALIGTTYGGDGVTSFGLPNLQGRFPVGTGQGLGLSNYVLGQSSGNENTTLITGNLPPHTHPVVSVAVPISSGTDSGDPNGNYYGVADSSFDSIYETSGGTAMANNVVNSNATGSGVPFNIQSPYQVVNYCICIEGVFPSRN